jgi:hypothetical protein
MYKRIIFISFISRSKSCNQKSKSCVVSLCSVNKLLRLLHFVSVLTKKFWINWREDTARTHHIFGHSASGCQNFMRVNKYFVGMCYFSATQVHSELYCTYLFTVSESVINPPSTKWSNQTSEKTNRIKDLQTYTDIHRQTDKHTDIQTVRKYTKTGRQTDVLKDKCVHIHTYST